MEINGETKDSPEEKAQTSEVAILNGPVCQQYLEFKLTAQRRSQSFLNN